MFRTFVVALCALFLSAANAQQAPSAAAVEQARAAPKRGFLWEARKGERRVYLLGTIHVGKAEFHPPNAEYLARYAQVDAIAVEADLSNAQKVGAAVQDRAFYRIGTPGLETRIAPALRTRLEAFAQRNGLAQEQLWRMKPWMAANTIVVIEAVRAGFNPAYAMEAFLFGFAATAGKPIVEIESVDNQLRLFDAAPESTQMAYLQMAVDAIDSGANRDEVTQLVDAWDKRDGAEMERLLAKMHASRGVAERFVVEKIIDARHPAMVDAIERFVASGKLHLVAVGSLHFFGPNGLIAMLRQRGYTVAPIE